MKITETKLILVGTVIVFLFFRHVFLQNYEDIKKNGRYAIGEVYHRGKKSEVGFKFITKDNLIEEQYRGIQSLPFFSNRKKIKEGDKYLLIYSTKNPKNSIWASRVKLVYFY